MFKSIEELRHKRLKYIKEFIKECSIEEKIDTYYVSIHILNSKDLVFYKSNGRQLDRIDLIINDMWQPMVSDWLQFKAANEIWFLNHIGFKIDFFYFPVEKPIQTQYKPGLKYLVCNIEKIDGLLKSDDPELEMSGMKMLDKFDIKFMHGLHFKEIDVDEISEELLNILKNKSEETLSDFFESIVEINPGDLWAASEPEGFVFRHGKKNKYAITKTDQEERRDMASSQKTQYEFFLLDFLKYYENCPTVDNLLSQSYVKTVCSLFNDYIQNWESERKEVESNVDPESLQNPYVGHRFDLCYSNILDLTTQILCRESELWRNIFKILLVNLKKRKKEDASYMLMTPDSVKRWNEIVDTVSNSCSAS